MRQTGARYLAKERNKLRDREEVTVQHYVSDEISIPVKDGVRKRPRILRRKAD